MSKQTQPDKATARPINCEQVCIGVKQADDVLKSSGTKGIGDERQAVQDAMQIVNEHAALVAIEDYAKELIVECGEVGRSSHLCLDHSTIQKRFEKLIANLAAIRNPKPI